MIVLATFPGWLRLTWHLWAGGLAPGLLQACFISAARQRLVYT
jgi:hypothetical protein